MITTLCSSHTCGRRKVCARHIKNEDLIKDLGLVFRMSTDFSKIPMFMFQGLISEGTIIPMQAECREENGFKKFIELVNKNEPEKTEAFTVEWFDTFVDFKTDIFT